jgi:hypothetical protein
MHTNYQTPVMREKGSRKNERSGASFPKSKINIREKESLIPRDHN